MRKLALVAVSAALPLMTITPSLAQSSGARPPSQAQTQAQQQPSPQNSKMNGQLNRAAANLSQDEIRQVQQALDRKGFKAGRADGRLGSETKSALNQFQQKQGLQQTGTPDEQTLAALGVGTGTTGQAPSGQQPNQNNQGGHPEKQP